MEETAPSLKAVGYRGLAPAQFRSRARVGVPGAQPARAGSAPTGRCPEMGSSGYRASGAPPGSPSCPARLSAAGRGSPLPCPTESSSANGASEAGIRPSRPRERNHRGAAARGGCIPQRSWGSPFIPTAPLPSLAPRCFADRFLNGAESAAPPKAPAVGAAPYSTPSFWGTPA